LKGLSLKLGNLHFSTLESEAEELMVLWIAGHFRDEFGRKIKVAFVRRQSQTVFVKDLPFGTAVTLIPGNCIKKGRLLQLDRLEVLRGIRIPSLADGAEVDASQAIPRSLYDFHGHRGWGQKLLRYEVGGWTYLIPTFELIRGLFLRSRALSYALMEPAGLQQLAITPMPDHFIELLIDFTMLMPFKSITPALVREWAWIACTPEVRPSWDSVLLKSQGQSHFSFDPPKISAKFDAKVVTRGNLVLILRMTTLSERRLPCETLKYAHPSITRTAGSLPFQDNSDGASAEVSSGLDINEPAISGATSSRKDVHQDTIELFYEAGGFVKFVPVKASPFFLVAVDEGSTDGTDPIDEAPASGPKTDGNTDDSREQIVRYKRQPRGLSAEMEGGLAKPLEFKLLEQAPLDAAGECAYLVRAIELMTERIVNLTISIGVCFLRDGRKISRVGDNRRGCMVALLQRKGRHPLVLIDVDHASLEGLSALVLRFHKMAELSTIEEAIQHQLSELVRYGHRWNPNAENLSPETYSAERLPRLMRTRGRPVTSSYVTIWAEELIDRLFERY
jgi:hypothetical protein